MSLESELLAAGWKKTGKTRGNLGVREIWQRSGWRILGSSKDHDHWTLQRMSGKHVNWFVDFPKQVGVQAILVFVMQCEIET